MEAGHLCENPANSSTARNTSSNHLRLQKADAPSFSSKQSSHQTKRNNKKLPTFNWVQAATDMHPRLPQQETKSSTKQLPPTDPILGPENLLKTGFAQKGPPSSLLLCLVLLFVLGLFGVLLRLPSPLVPHGVWWLISGCPRLDIWLLRQRSGRLAGLRPAAPYTVVLSALMEIVQVVCFATLAKVPSCPQMGCVGTLGLTKGFSTMTFISFSFVFTCFAHLV